MSVKRKIIFRQGQSPGDILTMTRGLYDVKRAFPDWEIDVRTPCPELFANSPYLVDIDEADPDVEVYDIAYDEINISGWNGLHFADAFRHDIEKKINSNPEMVAKYGYCKVPSTGLLPELFLSDDEKSWYNQVHCSFYWDGQFWLLNAGRKNDNELKQYHRWQEVVNILNEEWQGKVRIVQIGHRGSVGMPHIHPELTGVFDLIGRTDMRQLIRLAYWATGIIGPISFQFVLSAAFEKPSVVVAGGKEGTRWHLYNHVQWIKKNGCLPCAVTDGCWLGGGKGKCKNLVRAKDMDEDVPLCFEITTPQEIADRVLDYYRGKRLEMPAEELWYQDGRERFHRYYEMGKFPPDEVYK